MELARLAFALLVRLVGAIRRHTASPFPLKLSILITAIPNNPASPPRTHKSLKNHQVSDAAHFLVRPTSPRKVAIAPPAKPLTSSSALGGSPDAFQFAPIQRWERALIEASGRLHALKALLPQDYSVEAKYFAELHSILDSLERETGLNLSRYRMSSVENRTFLRINILALLAFCSYQSRAPQFPQPFRSRPRPISPTVHEPPSRSAF
jgi:hypothetical protein